MLLFFIEKNQYVSLKKQNISPGLCAINLKRRDSLLLNTTTVIEINNETDWKLVEEYEFSDPVHGGRNWENTTTALEWFKIVRSGKSWNDAKKTCEEIGGSLVVKFNSTNDHLMLIGRQLQAKFWVGATDVISQSEFHFTLSY